VYLDELDDKRQVTVILRLVLEHSGALHHGEVIDVDGNVRGRFNRWSTALVLIRDWVNTRVVD
jgi:hypothetical protein